MELDKETKMSITVEWMKKKYDEFNKNLFNGLLGECEFNVFTKGKGSQGNVLGWFSMRGKNLYTNKYTRQMFMKDVYLGLKVLINKDNFCNLCKPIIEINGNYIGTEYAFSCTLIHEMCHYYTYMNGKAPTQAHGKEFRQISQMVQYNSRGLFTIKRVATAEEMSGYELSQEMQQKRANRIANKQSKLFLLFVYKSNGEVRLISTTSNKLINDIIKLEEKRDNTTYIYLSQDRDLIEKLYNIGYRKASRTYRYWNVENTPWIEEIFDEYDIDEIYQKQDKAVNERYNMRRHKKQNIRKYIDFNKIRKLIDEAIETNMEKLIDEDDVEDYNAIKIDNNANLGLASPFEDDDFDI